MNSGLLSIIFGITIAAIVWIIINEDKSLPAQRLHNLKAAPKKNINQEHSNDFFKDGNYKNPIFKKVLSHSTLTEKIKRMLKIADIKMPIDIFVLWSTIPAVILLMLAFIFSSKVAILVLLSALSAVSPTIFLKVKFIMRRNAFLQLFPDTLDLIAGSLRAGHSLLTSFQTVVQEMPEPVCSVFKGVYDDIALGKDTKDAMQNMSECMPGCLDLRFFITAVLIQREIGGNLAEILDSLNYTIRERFKLLGQIKVQTAQAKLSGLILGLAPIGLFLIIRQMQPTYLEPLFTTIIGQFILGLAITMAVIGFIIINKVTDIKV